MDTLSLAMPMAPGDPRPRYEIADILRNYGGEYRARHPLPPHVHRVLNAIQTCRTAVLGGHVERCDGCGAERVSYNSCRDRHCPKCQRLEQARWVEARQEEVLPVPYFHTVFTLPHDLNPWAVWNPEHIYDLLFHSAAETLQDFAQRHWQGQLGLTAVLHTWGQNTEHHIHLHCIVPGGALSADGERFTRCPRRDWLFPVEGLSRVFREHYCRGLHCLHDSGRLVALPGHDVTALLAALGRPAWVVYAKPPFAGADQVIDYLSRYTHRVVIANSRLVDIAQGRVSFTWKDYRDASRLKVMTLSAEEFLRRFILHILPPHFVRIRYYGLLACGQRRARLNQARRLLQLPPVATRARLPYDEFLRRLTGRDITRCPQCGGQLRRERALVPAPVTSRHDPPVMGDAA